MQEIRKIDMAFQQLEDALAAYFNGRYHSALVLAAAAEQLLAGYMHLQKLEPAFTSMRKAIVKMANTMKPADVEPTTEKNIGDLLNRAYNHSHHAGKTKLEVQMNPRFEAQETIDRAISNFDALSAAYDLPVLPLAQRFLEESAGEIALEAAVEDVLSPIFKANEA